MAEKKAHTFIISDESIVNSYGIRVMTNGIDTKQYKRNPIVLWYHKRPNRWSDRNTDDDALPIGKAIKLWKEDGKLMADIEFDHEDEFAVKVEGKVERGYINMCSPGLEIITISDDMKYLLTGQTRSTLVKSSLEEISIVDVGSNRNALKLYKNNNYINISENEFNDILPLVNNQSKNNNTMNEIQKRIALLLNLNADASDDSIMNTLESQLKLAKQANDYKTKFEGLQASVDEMNQSRIIALVDQHQDKKFTADKRETFLQLGKDSGYDTLKNVIEAMLDIVKPTELINPSSVSNQVDADDKTMTFVKLKEKGVKEIEKFKKEHSADYIRLYKDEYGIELEMEE